MARPKNSSMLLTTANLQRVLDALLVTPDWRKAMASIRASESLAFSWRSKCLTAMKSDDKSSIFWMEYRGAYDWWVNFCGRCRTENVMLYEGLVRHQAMHGIETVVRDASQKILYQEVEEYIGQSDDFVRAAEGLGDWEDVSPYRLKRDEAGRPLAQIKVEQIPAPLRLRILEQDRRYVERKEIDAQVQVTAVAKPLQRLPGEERPTLEKMAELKRLASLTPEQRRAELNASAFPLDASGRRTLAPSGLPSSRDDNLAVIEKPSPYAAPYRPPEATQNAPTRPSYARPDQRLDRGESTGDGSIPSGGMKMV